MGYFSSIGVSSTYLMCLTNWEALSDFQVLVLPDWCGYLTFLSNGLAPLLLFLEFFFVPLEASLVAFLAFDLRLVDAGGL